MKSKTSDLVCIVCPLGCRLTLVTDETSPGGYQVLGNQCKRGSAYAIEELTNPTRQLTTTVAIALARLKRLPVRSDSPLPKGLCFECMSILSGIQVEAPIKMGTIIVENILDTGVNIIASRDMPKGDDNGHFKTQGTC